MDGSVTSPPEERNWLRRLADSTLLAVVCIVVGVIAVGSWARPWRFAEGNPDLRHGQTATTAGRVVGGCAVGDSRNEINCVQYLDFDVGSVAVRRAPVQVTDGFRQSAEDPNGVPVLYDVTDPHRFRLVDGNPGAGTRVLGTLWMSFVTVVGGGLAGVVLLALAGFAACRGRSGRRARKEAAEPAAD